MYLSVRRLAALAILLASLAAGTALAGDRAVPRTAPQPRDGIVAYYFHTTFRCVTCRKLEELSREAIETGFAGELASGKLAFRAVNVQTPENAHFIQDFQLVTKSLVLVECRDGKVVRWKNLAKVWQLVRNRDAFIRYVQEETRAFLGEG